MQINNAQKAVRSLGIFRSLRGATIYFNLIIFRVAVGVLLVQAGLPATIVALVSMLEFTLNAIFEVPFGYLADRLGRVPAIVTSLALIICGLICVYVSLLVNNEYSRSLYIAYGLILGIAKPLYTGAIEGFYQNAIHSLCQDRDEEKILLNSLTYSQQYGKYFSIGAILLAFFLCWIFNLLAIVPHLFLIDILLYAINIAILLQDYSKYGDLDKKLQHTPLIDLIKQIFSNPTSRASIICSLFNYMLSMAPGGFLVIALGRENSGFHGWVLMVVYMLSLGTGNIMRGYLLPKWIDKLSPKNYLLLNLLLLFLVCMIGIFISKVNFAIYVLFIFFFGIMFITSFGAIANLVNNQMMSVIQKQDHVTALSIQNVPSFFLVGLYSGYVMFYSNGAPTTYECIAITGIATAVFSLFVLKNQL